MDAFIETYNIDAESFVWTKSKVHQRRVKRPPSQGLVIPGTRGKNVGTHAEFPLSDPAPDAVMDPSENASLPASCLSGPETRTRPARCGRPALTIEVSPIDVGAAPIDVN